MYQTILGYTKLHSVTNILFELGFSSFDTVLCNSKSLFLSQLCKCDNGIIQYIFATIETIWCTV